MGTMRMSIVILFFMFIFIFISFDMHAKNIQAIEMVCARKLFRNILNGK